MEFWVNLSAILQIPASIATVIGLSAVQIVHYYHKNRSPKQPPASPNTFPKVTTESSKSILGWLDLAMALLISSIASVITTFCIIFWVRMFSYLLVPEPNPQKTHAFDVLIKILNQELFGINFSDARFDIAFLIGIVPGVIIGAWAGRSFLRTLLKGKGLLDWLTCSW